MSALDHHLSPRLLLPKTLPVTTGATKLQPSLEEPRPTSTVQTTFSGGRQCSARHISFWPHCHWESHSTSRPGHAPGPDKTYPSCNESLVELVGNSFIRYIYRCAGARSDEIRPRRPARPRHINSRARPRVSGGLAGGGSVRGGRSVERGGGQLPSAIGV